MIMHLGAGGIALRGDGEDGCLQGLADGTARSRGAPALDKHTAASAF